MPARLGGLFLNLVSGQGDGARSGRGAVAAFLIRVVSAAIAFASQVLLARWMGSFEFGVFTFAWVWITMLGTLCTLGFSTSVVRYLPQYRATGARDHERGFLRFGQILSLATGTACLAVGSALLLLWGAGLDPVYVVPMCFALVCLPAAALSDFQDGVGRAKGWLDLGLMPPYILRPLLLIGLVAACVVIGLRADAATAALAAIAATWAAAGLQFVLLQCRLRRELVPGQRRYQPRTWIQVSLPLLLLDGFTVLMFNLDLLLLSLFVAPDQVGIYFAAVRCISLVSFVQFAVVAVAMPRFARLHAQGDSAGIAALLRDMQLWCLVPSAAGAALLLIVGKPLLGLFGTEFVAGYPVMFILAGGLLVRALGGAAQSLLIVSGHQRAAAGILALTVLINGGLCLALVPGFGLIGAGLAAAVAFAFEALASLALAHRHFGSPLPAPGEKHGAAAG